MRWTTGGKTAMSGSTWSLLALLLSTQCVAQLSDIGGAVSTGTSLGGGASSTTSAASSSNRATTSSAATTAKATTTTGSFSASLMSDTSTTSSTQGAETTSGGSIFHLSNLPTLAGASIPTLIVPYTANAPFMQKSSMPEGSVFIIVGAILGFFGACVLAWRGLVALSLKRSVKRAALAQQQTFDLKSQPYVPPSGGVYASGPPGSSASMEKLAAIPKRGDKRHSQRPSTSQGLPSALSSANRGSTANLFFSPTAGAGLHSHNPSPAISQRPGSNYLPAGYYAAGSSLPAGGAATTHINAHANNNRGSSMLNPLTDRLSGMRAESAGYQRAGSFGPSPPDSPAMSPSTNHLQRIRTDSPGASSVGGQVGGPTIGGNGLYAQSGSSLNLNVPGGTQQAGGRTPSAYLEDLFEEHGSGPRERF